MERQELLPKVDLHCHLDGSLTPAAIRQMKDYLEKSAVTGDRNIPDIPADQEGLMHLLQVPENCQNLAEYLKCFELPLAFLIKEKCFEVASYELMRSAAEENVIYQEIRFAPLLSEREGLSSDDTIRGVLAGIARAQHEYNIRGNVIVCFMRNMPVDTNIRLLRRIRHLIGKGVCAIDIAGDEASYPTVVQRKLFEYARCEGIPFTVHAGECGDFQNIQDAVELGAMRIGHGIAMQNSGHVKKLCSDKGIGVEMCPTSNLQTKAVASLEEYPILEFINEGIPVSVNTDNRTVSNTTMARELGIVKEHFGLSEEIFIKNAIETSFADQETKAWMREKLRSFLDCI